MYYPPWVVVILKLQIRVTSQIKNNTTDNTD